MIYTFTGTGNSLWIARELGKQLGEKVTDIMSVKNESIVNCTDPRIGFVFPTYMMDLPWIVKEFMLRLHIAPDSYTFVVMTSSQGKSGKAFRSLDQALRRSKATLSAAFDVQMPGNCIPSSEEEYQKRLETAPQCVKQIAEKISAGMTNFTSDGSRMRTDYVERSFFYGEHSLKAMGWMKKFLITDKCNGCGICESVCPTENISIENGKAVHGHNCAACYRCLHWCPEHAALLKVPKLKHRSQYTHPQINLGDIQSEKKC